MPYSKPIAEEFDIQENKLIHRPTGATFSRYPGPTESREMTVKRKRAGDGMPDGEEYWQAIRVAAFQMLFPE
jgi:hypothetical protein